MKRNVIIFDLDGVLFDTIELIYSLTKQEYGDLSSSEFKELHKSNIHESLDKWSHRKIKETDADREQRHAAYSKKKSETVMYSGMRDLVIELAKENDLVLNTSALTRTSLPLLEKQGIDNYFSLFATKDLSSSKVEKFKLIAEKFGKKPGEMIFITDTIGDLREAQVAGVPTVVVTWGLHAKEDFGMEQYDNFISFAHSAEELMSTVKSFLKL